MAARRRDRDGGQFLIRTTRSANSKRLRNHFAGCALTVAVALVRGLFQGCAMIANLLLVAALNVAPALQTADVPRCSATVTDECLEAGAPPHHHAKAVHHHKKHSRREK
jgi:hypothetical protein